MSEGVEVQLTGVPKGVGPWALKDCLWNQFGKPAYDFLAVLELYAEDILWEAFKNPKVTNTARVSVPNPAGAPNPLTDCIGKQIKIWDGGQQYQMSVALATQPETTDQKYKDLRQARFFNPVLDGISDGPLGDIEDVSCGFFDSNDAFQPTRTLSKSPVPSKVFNKFSFFGDYYPKRFQLCLTESSETSPLLWEWADFHTTNIRGVIFDNSLNNESSRLVYIIVDKPPQFYQRTVLPPTETYSDPNLNLAGSALNRSGTLQPTNDVAAGFVDSQIPFPSTSIPGSTDVCGIPWEIQYSRVFRIKYKPQHDFNFASFKPRLSLKKQATIFSFNVAEIPISSRTESSMQDSMKQNMTKVTQYPVACQLAVLKLFLNCNVSILSDDGSKLDQAIRNLTLDLHLPADVRRFNEVLEQSAHDMETNHIRSLRRIYSNLPQSDPRLPAVLTGDEVEPAMAISQKQKSVDFQRMMQRNKMAPKAFMAVVYPSHLELYGPQVVNTNTITDQLRTSMDKLLRVRFLSNDGTPYHLEPGIDPNVIIEKRLVNVLTQGYVNTVTYRLFPLTQQDYEFLGYSVSGLKKRKAVWFFRNDGANSPSANSIRNSIGNWSITDPKAKSLAKNPSKWGARVALAFTESIPIQNLSSKTWSYRDDVAVDPELPNSDGCGNISDGLNAVIATKLSQLGYKKSYAYQIRFGGVKGVVYTAPPSLMMQAPKFDLDMLLRSSQIKFNVQDASEIMLRIVSTTGDAQSSLFFDALLKTLEDLGADTSKIMKIYETAYDALINVKEASVNLLRDILKVPDDDRDTGMKSRNALLKLAIKLQSDGITPEQYRGSFLTSYLLRLADWARSNNLFAIPIPNSYSALGLTDDYRILDKKTPSEVYVRAKGSNVSGDILVYRDPIIHIGDIQKATALSDDDIKQRIKTRWPQTADSMIQTLLSMDNVIFFSQFEAPPLPNRLSGGDLDGDRFEIIAQPGTFWNGSPFQTVDPDKYGAGPDPDESTKDFDVGALCNFIGQYVRNDCFSTLQTTLMCLADLKPTGMNDADVKSLAAWISKAVDYAKNGVAVNLNRDIANDARFKVVAKPDFIRAMSLGAFYDSRGEYYESPKLLGQIYRKVKDYVYPDANSLQSNNLALKDEVSNAWTKRLSSHGVVEKQDRITASMTKFVQSEVITYREYLKGRIVPNGDEMEILMKKPIDDFPEGHIQGLVTAVLQSMAENGVVDPIEVTNDSGYGIAYKLNTSFSIDMATSVFQRTLLGAWEAALDQASKSSADRAYASGYGQTYAFICLYVLYCRPFPIIQ